MSACSRAAVDAVFAATGAEIVKIPPRAVAFHPPATFPAVARTQAISVPPGGSPPIELNRQVQINLRIDTAHGTTPIVGPSLRQPPALDPRRNICTALS
jgi:hypothetical protein